MFREAMRLIKEEIKLKAIRLEKWREEVSKEKLAKENEIGALKEAEKQLVRIQGDWDRSQGNLAVQKKGVCPYPEDCNEKGICIKNSCSADVCSNGYAYRMS